MATSEERLKPLSFTKPKGPQLHTSVFDFWHNIYVSILLQLIKHMALRDHATSTQYNFTT